MAKKEKNKGKEAPTATATVTGEQPERMKSITELLPKMHKSFNDYIEEKNSGPGYYDFFEEHVQGKWYEVEGAQYVAELEDKLREAQITLSQVEDELEALDKQEEERAAISKDELKEAIKNGRDVKNFKSASAVDYEKKKAELTAQAEHFTNVVEILAGVLDDAKMDAYNEEIKKLQAIQAQALEEIEKAKDEFERTYHTRINLVIGADSVLYELGLRVDVLRMLRGQIQEKQYEEKARKRNQERWKKLKEETGGDPASIFNRTKLMYTDSKGNPIASIPADGW